MSEITIKLSPEVRQRLARAAAREGLELHDFAAKVLEEQAVPEERKRWWQEYAEAAQRIPDEELANVPTDASETLCLRSITARVDEQAPRPIWDEIREIWNDVPEEELAKIPSDASENLDHYLYGAPRKSE
jgi:hypothetical protein